MPTGGSFTPPNVSSENIIDFSVNTDPNLVGTIFSPNIVESSDLFYHSEIDDTLWIWNGATYIQTTGVTILKKYTGTQSLIQGSNTIVHNLHLLHPYSSTLEIRDAVTGNLIVVTVDDDFTDSIVLTSSLTVPSVKVTIIG